MKLNQTVSTELKHGCFDCVTVETKNVKPSWKEYGDGYNEVKLCATGLEADKPNAGWLEIVSTEETDNYQRTTSVVIGVEGMKALRDMLNKLDLGD